MHILAHISLCEVYNCQEEQYLYKTDTVLLILVSIVTYISKGKKVLDVGACFGFSEEKKGELNFGDFVVESGKRKDSISCKDPKLCSASSSVWEFLVTLELMEEVEVKEEFKDWICWECEKESCTWSFEVVEGVWMGGGWEVSEECERDSVVFEELKEFCGGIKRGGWT